MFHFDAIRRSVRHPLSLSLIFTLWSNSLCQPVTAATGVVSSPFANKHLTTSRNHNYKGSVPAPQATSTVQFSQSSYTVGEGDGHLAVIVTRTGDSSGAASVNYATSDTAALNDCNIFSGIASQRCDYAISAGKLSFTAGETSKTIFIPIVD